MYNILKCCECKRELARVRYSNFSVGNATLPVGNLSWNEENAETAGTGEKSFVKCKRCKVIYKVSHFGNEFLLEKL